MRLYLKLKSSDTLIPFNYQHLLVSAIHRWIGSNNEIHGNLSLYSFSWLQNINVNTNGLKLKDDSYFFLSCYDELLIKRIVKGILDSPLAFSGCCVNEVEIAESRKFGTSERFNLGSPVFIKRTIDNREKHYTFNDPESNDLMTATLKAKLLRAGLDDTNIAVKFDENFSNPKTKLIHYKNIGNKANLCPVIISGSPEQISFAWHVGIGSNTGIGFGALK